MSSVGTRGRLALAIAAVAALAAAEPRLHLAFEDRGDPRPHQFSLSGEIVGLAMGLVISWSDGERRQLR
ncbi:hypothetical protein [Sandarakinorhabdus sp.]|uniref:hypothetical protein n=1 Tax=Sandarakinorhabdus sp. TaxID=1916663 RepID=UPI00286E0DAC|nr:hypothetical protein [Sandarakinorhabdus sp.]